MNKKIRNATKVKVKGITFKSQTEKTVYNALVSKGITPAYESKTFLMWEGFKPITPFYDQETDKQHEERDIHTPKQLVLKDDKVVGIRYTPDFYFKVDDLDVWIEVKGKENDVFYIKKKMFRKYLDDLYLATGQKSIFFEIYTKYQLLQALKIIEEYGKANRHDESND